MKKFAKKLYDQIMTLPTQEIQTYAGSTAFFLLLAAVPLAMFLLALMQYTPLAHIDLMAHISISVPNTVKPLVDEVFKDIENNGSATLLSVSVATAIYTATRGVFSLMKGMNVMYGVKDDRKPFLKWIIAGIYTIITVLLILLAAILLVLADTIRNFITKTFPHITALVEFIINVRMITMLATMTFFFLLIYLVLPNRHSKMLHQLPGAVFSALGWVISSVAFSFYLEHFANYSQIYGSLTTIIVAMIWIYMLMSILFTGALVNVVWYNIFIAGKDRTKVKTQPHQ